MSLKKNPPDPRRLALTDKLDKARADYERWYARLKRAFNALEKARQRAVRLARSLERLDAAQEAEEIVDLSALARVENMYPADWPRCVFCGQPALDGHLTCGRASCPEGQARDDALRDWHTAHGLDASEGPPDQPQGN